VSVDTTIPARIKFAVGAKIKPASGKTVTFEKDPDAGDHQIFDLSAGGAVSGIKEGKAAWFGVAGDSVATADGAGAYTFSGTDDTTLLQAAVAACDLLDLGAKKYRVTGKINGAGLTIRHRGAELHRSDDTNDYVIEAIGTYGTFHAVDADCARDQNVITCAALAPLVAPGTLLKLKGTLAKFNVSEGSYPGEMHVVQSISGNDIRLTGPLKYSYTVAADAHKIGIITPVDFAIDGGGYQLSILRSGNENSTRGIRVCAAKGLRLDVEVSGATDRAVVVEDCYAPRVNWLAFNSVKSTSGAGYGLQIVNSTMYGRYDGISMNARHCVSAGASANDPEGVGGGVSWDNVVSATGSGGYASVVFDAHASCGSIIYENCIAIGGLHTKQDGTQVRAQGWNVGARYVTIRNCKVIGCGNVVAVDSSATLAMETMDIDGLELTDCTAGVFALTGALQTVSKLRIHNVRGSIGATGNSAAVLITAGTVGAWDLSDIRVGGAAIAYIASGAVVPSTLVLRNCTVTGTSSPGVGTAVDTAEYGVRNASTSLTRVVLQNCEISGRSMGVYSTVAIGLRLQNTRILDCTVATWLTATPTDLVAEGCRFETLHTQPTYGVFNVTAAGTIAGACAMDQCVVTNDLYAFGHTGTYSVLLPGQNQFPSGFSGFARTLATGWLEYVGGGVNSPRIVRGSGTPEGVVTAKPGALYVDTAGATAAAMLYVKGSGTGNTGWAAQGQVEGVVIHGGTAGTTRPSGYVRISWVGWTTPTNAATYDTWDDLSATAPAHVNSQSAEVNAVSGTTLTITKPVGLATGHVMIAQIAHRDTTLTLPTDWVLVGTVGGANARHALAYKIVTNAGTEPASYDFVQGSNVGRMAGGISAWSGCHLTTPVHTSASGTTGTGTTSVTAPTVTPTIPNCRIMRFWTCLGANGITEPSGTSRYGISNASATQPNVKEADATLTDPAATGTAVATAAVGSTNSGWTVALAPAAVTAYKVLTPAGWATA
jgi:hypothetical protein